MADSEKQKGFWQTLPGILTGVAALLTAVTGLVIGLVQNGVLRGKGGPAHDSELRSSGSTGGGKDSGTSDGARRSQPGGKIGGITANAGSPAESDSIDLLASGNGGKVVVATSEEWSRTIVGEDGYAVVGAHKPEEAVYGFRDNGTAVFDSFKMLVTVANPSNGSMITSPRLCLSGSSHGPINVLRTCSALWHRGHSGTSDFMTASLRSLA